MNYETPEFIARPLRRYRWIYKNDRDTTPVDEIIYRFSRRKERGGPGAPLAAEIVELSRHLYMKLDQYYSRAYP